MQGAFLEDGERLPRPWDVCREMGFSYGAFLAWVNCDEGRVRRFWEAMKVRAHLLKEETIVIADGSGDARLMVAQRNVLAKDWNPEKYGTKVRHEHDVADDLGERLRRALARVGEREVMREVEGEVVEEVAGEAVISDAVAEPGISPGPVPSRLARAAGGSGGG
jgi:hypothetical protein